MINNWSYLREYETHRQAILEAVDRVFSSGRLILGRQVEEFERKFSQHCGVRHAVGVNSGTDALFLALKALGVGAGDEVVTVANTAVPTVAAIRATGATPVFVDVEEHTFLMDVWQLEAALTDRTRCIMPVHLYGQPVDMAPLMELARLKGLKVVEDCAQVAGATYCGRKVGTWGHIGAFSFYPTKVLGAYGDAGMAVTDEAQYARRLKSLRFYGLSGDGHCEEEGYNSRLDEVQAAILNYKLQFLDKAVEARCRIAGLYSRELAGVGDIELPIAAQGRTHQFYLYTIKTAQRDKLLEHLKRDNIEARVHYPVPIHLMRGYGFFGYKAGDLPVTEKNAGRILSLPLYPELEDSEVSMVIESIRRFFQGV